MVIAPNTPIRVGALVTSPCVGAGPRGAVIVQDVDSSFLVFFDKTQFCQYVVKIAIVVCNEYITVEWTSTRQTIDSLYKMWEDFKLIEAWVDARSPSGLRLISWMCIAK